MINIHKDEKNKLKWKSGYEDWQSVAITDITISSAPKQEFMSGMGTAGWAPPEQWLGDWETGARSYFPEDSFSFGRMLIFMFSNWSLAWKLSFSPGAQIER